MNACYYDPLNDVVEVPYGTTRPVFVPLPTPVLSLVPSAVLDDDEDPSPVDPRSWDDIPVQAEPDEFRAAYVMASELAANDDWPTPEPYDPDHHDADVVPPAAVTAEPKRSQRVRPGLAAKPRKATAPACPSFKPSPGMRSSDKMKALCLIARTPGLHDSTKAVAIPLINKINPDEGVAFLSLNRLAESADVSWRTAQRAVLELEAAGLILVDRIEGAPMNIAFVLDRLSEAPATTTKAKARSASRGSRPQPTPDRADRGTPDRADTPPPDRADTHKWKGELGSEMKRERQEHEAAAASAPSSPVRSHLSFDDGWPVFKKAWPVLIDDHWRPAFIGARRDGWSLQQLLDGILHVQASLPDGAVMVNVGRFFGQQMWMVIPDDQPEHHEYQHEPMKSSWPEDDDADIAF